MLSANALNLVQSKNLSFGKDINSGRADLIFYQRTEFLVTFILSSASSFN